MSYTRIPLGRSNQLVTAFFLLVWFKHTHTHDLFFPRSLKLSWPSHLQSPRIFDCSSTNNLRATWEMLGVGAVLIIVEVAPLYAASFTCRLKWDDISTMLGSQTPSPRWCHQLWERYWGCTLVSCETVLRIINYACYQQWMGSHNISLPIIDNFQFRH